MNHLLFIDAPIVIVVALIFLLLFGGKKIPELMHGLGKGIKSFKEGMNDVENDIKFTLKETPKEKTNNESDNTIK
ncbi:MAG: twin-arginine translocase TatA/TatE family subunit [Paludibacter sp.]